MTKQITYNQEVEAYNTSRCPICNFFPLKTQDDIDDHFDLVHGRILEEEQKARIEELDSVSLKRIGLG